MKKKLTFSVVPVLLLALGFILTGCDNPTGGGGGSNPPTPPYPTYIGSKDGITYTLTITKDPQTRAASYKSPQTGNGYILALSGNKTGESKGKIEVNSTIITLIPAGYESNTMRATVKFDSDWKMTMLTGVITLTDGTFVTAPGVLGDNTSEGAVALVEVTPNTASPMPGQTQQFNATITYGDGKTEASSTKVTWTVSGGSGDSTISSSGLLSVDAGEADGAVLTVKATSTENTAKSGTAAVTVTHAATYSISLSPSSVDFGIVLKDESAPAVQEITVTNNGNQNTGTLTVSSLTNYTISLEDTSGGGSVVTEIAVGDTAYLRVQPTSTNAGGVYDGTITISNSNITSGNEVSVTFTVLDLAGSGVIPSGTSGADVAALLDGETISGSLDLSGVSGAIDLTGSLTLDTGASITGGTINTNGATVAIGTGSVTLTGTTLELDSTGTLTLTGSTVLTLAGGSTLTLNGGTFTHESGAQIIIGSGSTVGGSSAPGAGELDSEDTWTSDSSTWTN